MVKSDKEAIVEEEKVFNCFRSCLILKLYQAAAEEAEKKDAEKAEEAEQPAAKPSEPAKPKKVPG